MGLELFISWQAVIIAAITVTLTAGPKALVSAYWKGWRSHRGGKLLVSAIPLVIGTLVGAFIPIRPEAVVEYVANSGASPVLAFGAWGFVTGGVAGAWIFERWQAVVRKPEPKT